jgi:hypothetical protein
VRFDVQPKAFGWRCTSKPSPGPSR